MFLFFFFLSCLNWKKWLSCFLTLWSTVSRIEFSGWFVWHSVVIESFAGSGGCDLGLLLLLLVFFLATSVEGSLGKGFCFVLVSWLTFWERAMGINAGRNGSVGVEREVWARRHKLVVSWN